MAPSPPTSRASSPPAGRASSAAGPTSSTIARRTALRRRQRRRGGNHTTIRSFLWALRPGPDDIPCTRAPALYNSSTAWVPRRSPDRRLQPYSGISHLALGWTTSLVHSAALYNRHTGQAPCGRSARSLRERRGCISRDCSTSSTNVSAFSLARGWSPDVSKLAANPFTRWRPGLPFATRPRHGITARVASRRPVGSPVLDLQPLWRSGPNRVREGVLLVYDFISGAAMTATISHSQPPRG